MQTHLESSDPKNVCKKEKAQRKQERKVKKYEKLKRKQKKWDKIHGNFKPIRQSMDGMDTITRHTLSPDKERWYEDITTKMRGLKSYLNNKCRRELPDKGVIDELSDGTWLPNTFMQSYKPNIPYDYKYFDEFKYMGRNSNRFNKKARDHIKKTFKLITEFSKYLEQQKINFDFYELFESISKFKREVL